MNHAFLLIAGVVLATEGALVEVTAEAPRAETPGLRVLSYNIRHGAGMDNKVDLSRIAEVIRRIQPDLVALQEIDRNCKRSGGVDQAAELGRMLNMHHGFGKFMDYQGGEYGMAILSRFPLVEQTRHALPDGAEPRCALEVVVRVGEASEAISFISIHNDWTRPAYRVAQVRELITCLEKHKRPVILAGDFNAERESESMKILEQSGWKILEKKKEQKTWRSDQPSVEIDFVVIRDWPQSTPAVSTVHKELVASDHRPVSAWIPFKARERSK